MKNKIFVFAVCFLSLITLCSAAIRHPILPDVAPPPKEPPTEEPTTTLTLTNTPTSTRTPFPTSTPPPTFTLTSSRSPVPTVTISPSPAVEIELFIPTLDIGNTALEQLESIQDAIAQLGEYIEQQNPNIDNMKDAVEEIKMQLQIAEHQAELEALKQNRAAWIATVIGIIVGALLGWIIEVEPKIKIRLRNTKQSSKTKVELGDENSSQSETLSSNVKWSRVFRHENGLV